MSIPYVGRFAPSPTGPLHAGSLVAALASWLDARAHGGRWLVRIEDVDTPRCAAGAAQTLLGQLASCGLISDAAPVWQSTRGMLYERALVRLIASGWAYPCGCSRRDIGAAWRSRGAERPGGAASTYPGTCRGGLKGKPARALRVRVDASMSHPAGPLVVDWVDRRLGAQHQNVVDEVGDFVIRRADGLWAYQLAVVVDDAAQEVSHVVRGEDLADNTPRQIHLQRQLGLPTPRYLHTPLVLGPDGVKFSKQTAAPPLDLRDPRSALAAAAAVLGFSVEASTLSDWLAGAVRAWPSIAPRIDEDGRAGIITNLSSHPERRS